MSAAVFTEAPRVSVITPVRRWGVLPSEAIDSILAQTFTDLDILLVDDASIDAHPNIAGVMWSGCMITRV